MNDFYPPLTTIGKMFPRGIRMCQSSGLPIYHFDVKILQTTGALIAPIAFAAGDPDGRTSPPSGI